MPCCEGIHYGDIKTLASPAFLPSVTSMHPFQVNCGLDCHSITRRCPAFVATLAIDVACVRGSVRRRRATQSQNRIRILCSNLPRIVKASKKQGTHPVQVQKSTKINIRGAGDAGYAKPSAALLLEASVFSDVDFHLQTTSPALFKHNLQVERETEDL